jgi:predicted RNA binding protein YcfA (HicA-like mRNA interferase family)
LISLPELNHRQQRVLQEVFAEPVKANLDWEEIESLLIALGARRSEGRGSRVRFVLNHVPAVFHRPHPQKEIGKGTVRAVRKFLADAGINPC